MEWFLMALRKYAQFDGRSRRKEFWMFGLFCMIFACLAMALDMLLGLDFSGLYYGWIYLLYGAFITIPSIAVTVRRLHDVGKSGWMYFILLIPIIGGIWLFILMLKEGDRGANKYGEDPKQITFE